MRYTEEPWRDDVEENAKRKRKAKSKQSNAVVGEPPLKQEYAPLDHELTESGESSKSRKKNSSGDSFGQGCAFGGIIVIVILLFLCMLVMRGLSPVFESLAELVSILN